MPPVSLQRLATPCLPGPDATNNDPAVLNGVLMVAEVAGAHAPPADTIFPLLLNSAQSPVLKLPPPNQTADPSKVQVLTAVHP